MDLLDDDPSSPKAPDKPESFMRRFRKILILSGAALVALIVTIQHRGEQLTFGSNAPLAAVTPSAAAAGGGYDLSRLEIFSRALLYVRENYFDKNRFDPRRMLVGALDFLQRDVPEILVDRTPERDPKQVTIKVNGKQKVFSIENVDAPWSLRSAMQDIFKFVQPNLPPLPHSSDGKDEAKRLIEIEVTATNGMLYTLDPHSVLLDVESFKDMRMTTQGKFGGLGIVIGMDKKSRIIVRKPMPSTPAWNAGIKAKDRIVRINNESTVNMTLNEAVERLRGEPGSPVDVYIEREATAGAKKFTIVRNVIRPPALEDRRVLTTPPSAGPPQKVGYFKITNFSANTEHDLNEALAAFEKEKVKGIVMDLRGNPGGLYDQAQKVADAFIESGVVVSMVGVGGAQRKDEHASKSGDNRLPLVVLVNQNSASASEIVAGAIKHLDRGVVIGETTFGKGSVQMLFDITSPVKLGTKNDDDKLGLKLTTAQYLTAGDISIQGVGVSPDIEMVSLHVQKHEDEAFIRLQSSAHRRQESDYEWHLDNPTASKAGKPLETISYLFQPLPGWEKRLRDQDDDVDDDEEDPEDELLDDQNKKADFLMEFARDFLAQTKSIRRREMIEQSKAFFDKVRVEEDRKVAQALEKQLAVDWTPAPGPVAPGTVEVSLAPVGGKAKIAAGERLKVRGTVKNTGTTPVFRARAILRSENQLFDENEMVFGKIAPGDSKTYDMTVRVPKSMPTRTDAIRAEVSAQNPLKLSGTEMALDIEGKPHPLFAYTYQTIDDLSGNRDGRVQRGEKVRTLVKIKNIGAGAALKPQAILRNGPGQDGIVVDKGRFDDRPSPLKPGEVWTVSFEYTVGQEFRANEYVVELAVADKVFGEALADKIHVPIAAAGPVPEAASGTATVSRPEILAREAPNDGALVVGRVKKGTSFKVTGKSAGFLRVEIEDNHPAFVAAADVTTGSGQVVAASGAFAPEWQVTPPVLAVSAPTVVTGPSVRIKGVATDDREVRDLYVRVWNRDAKMPPKKVFYLPNRTGDRKKLSFETDIPLWPGSNLVQVFARETNEVQSLQTLIVRRGSPSLATTATTKPAAEVAR